MVSSIVLPLRSAPMMIFFRFRLSLMPLRFTSSASSRPMEAVQQKTVVCRS